MSATTEVLLEQIKDLEEKLNKTFEPSKRAVLELDLSSKRNELQKATSTLNESKVLKG